MSPPFNGQPYQPHLDRAVEDRGTAPTRRARHTRPSPRRQAAGGHRRTPPRLELGGARRIARGLEHPALVPTKWISQFETPEQQKGCWVAAHQMTLEPLPGGRQPPRLVGNTAGGRIDMARDSGHRGRVKPLPAAVDGRAYIDRMLDAGLRVMAGVTYPDDTGSPAQDHLGTRHFVTIYGRGYEPVEADRLFPNAEERSRRVYYLFRDPAPRRIEHATSGDFGWAKLFVDDDTGVLFKPGIDSGHGYVAQRDYSVTHVRVYQGAH